VKSLVRELASHVADGEEVNWDAIEAGDRTSDGTIANLRLIERRAEVSGARRLYKGQARHESLGARLAPWEAALLLVGGLRTILAIVGALAWPPATGRALAIVQLAVAGTSLLGAAVLLRGAGGDRRVIALAGVMLSGAAAAAWPTYRRISHQFLAPSHDLLLVLLPESFLAYWIWSFVAVFPRRRVEGWGDRTSVAIRRLSAYSGALLMAANAAGSLWPPLQPWLRPFERTGASVGYWGVIGVLSLIAFPAMGVAARRAEPTERHRTAVFLTAIAFGFVPLFVIELWAMAVQPGNPSSLTLALELLPALTVPFSTAYGVLAKRILPLRTLLHQLGRYLFARATLNLLLAAPILLGIAALAAHRDQPIADVLGGPLGRWLATGVAVAALATFCRRRLLATLDRAFNRESQDWHGQLARVSQGLATATNTDGLLAALQADVARPLGVVSLGVLRSIDEARAFVPVTSGASPLSADSGIALLTFAADVPLGVDPVHPGSVFWWLNEEDRLWIVDANASLLVPLSLGPRQCGLLVIGPRRADREYEGNELQFLSAAGTSLAIALERLSIEPITPSTVSLECACGRAVQPASSCECGGSVRPAQLPFMLAGRYQLERRLGQGAMGVVYAALDMELGRQVALKTLPEMSAEESIQLRQEARAMAAVSHPHIAVLYDIARWNGRPVLVEECMTLGTLADRLPGPRPILEVIQVGTALAAALAALHERSLIHRDLKPSNIGFAEKGDPKILDFGLADIVLGAGKGSLEPASRPASNGWRPAGTPRYLPPEAWRGGPVGPEGDLWALAMVFYESLSGTHPFDDAMPRLWLQRLERLPSPRGCRSDCPNWLSDLVVRGLCLDPLARWPSARWTHGYLVGQG
jgi:hypothetical protein